MRRSWRCRNCGQTGNRFPHCDGCDLRKSEGDARDVEVIEK